MLRVDSPNISSVNIGFCPFSDFFISQLYTACGYTLKIGGMVKKNH